MSDQIIERHLYHAEATALGGHLTLPLDQQIHPQAYATLGADGGYLSQRSEFFAIEEVMRYETAYTQVAGNVDTKAGHGWNTLVSSVVEGLNILDVLTADRVVAQISTDHPRAGYIPTVTFLGTRFEGLRIAGHPVHLDLDVNLVGDRPANDAPYIGQSGLMDRVQRQHDRILGAPDVPAEVASRFKEMTTTTQAGGNQSAALECSLVNQASGGHPGRCFGHVIDVPNFGKIYLAVLRVEESDYKPGTTTPRSTTFSLSMIECKFGCSIAGNASMARAVVNGQGQP
ncbi:MAG TPA: hypothetical protein VMA34_16970 [Terracidiphilus sp.]|nr:hypothetical protein [Terracidiphilus sp.]